VNVYDDGRRAVARNAGQLDPSQIRYYVMHTTEGDAYGSGTYEYLLRAGVSAHVVIYADGTRARVCDDNDIAWHAGITFNPSTPLYDGRNPNSVSRGLEFAGTYRRQLTPEQIASGVEQIREWRAIDGIDHPIVAHSELATGGSDMRRDPGDQNMAALQTALEDDMALSPQDKRDILDKIEDAADASLIWLLRSQRGIPIADGSQPNDPAKEVLAARAAARAARPALS
jgi:N-acetyl-anhydromuramyl-L-alanine amidase AmpD